MPGTRLPQHARCTSSFQPVKGEVPPPLTQAGDEPEAKACPFGAASFPRDSAGAGNEAYRPVS